jgi:hypothetical protein
VRAGRVRRRGRTARVRGGALARHARRDPASARGNPVGVGDRDLGRELGRAARRTARAPAGRRRAAADAVHAAFAELEREGRAALRGEGSPNRRSASSGGSICATSAPRPRSRWRSRRTQTGLPHSRATTRSASATRGRVTRSRSTAARVRVFEEESRAASARRGVARELRAEATALGAGLVLRCRADGDARVLARGPRARAMHSRAPR